MKGPSPAGRGVGTRAPLERAPRRTSRPGEPARGGRLFAKPSSTCAGMRPPACRADRSPKTPSWVPSEVDPGRLLRLPRSATEALASMCGVALCEFPRACPRCGGLALLSRALGCRPSASVTDAAPRARPERDSASSGLRASLGQGSPQTYFDERRRSFPRGRPARSPVLHAVACRREVEGTET